MLEPRGSPFPQRPCSACPGWHQPAKGHVSESPKAQSWARRVDLGLRGGKLVTDRGPS